MNTKSEINVWRLNLHTNKGVEKHIKTFNYCEENEFVGTGWKTQKGLMNCTQDIEFENRLEEAKKDFDNPNGFKSAMRVFKNMKPDDLIWTRKNNTYYLCRVKEIAKDFMIGDRSPEVENDIYDIWHYVPCEFIKIGTEENVIGAIVRSFNMGVACHIRGRGKEDIVREFSKKTYNEYTGKNYYSIKEPKNNWDYFWECMGALEIEEIVGLYMQMKLGYGIYTSTNKKDTKEYEYILFKRDNPKEKSKLQVKTSNINLDEYNIGDMPFYFFTTGNYWKNQKIVSQNQLNKLQMEKRIIIITKEELIKFAKENQKLLPYKLNWF